MAAEDSAVAPKKANRFWFIAKFVVTLLPSPLKLRAASAASAAVAHHANSVTPPQPLLRPAKAENNNNSNDDDTEEEKKRRRRAAAGMKRGGEGGGGDEGVAWIFVSANRKSSCFSPYKAERCKVEGKFSGAPCGLTIYSNELDAPYLWERWLAG